MVLSANKLALRSAFVASAIGILSASVAHSQIIPSDRTIQWGNVCGVPGGIPNRTIIFQTLNPGATTTDINNAIASCPSNQVVFLNAGTYNVGAIRMGHRTGVTLRGAGPGRTILNSSAGGACIDSDQYGFSGGQNITGGLTKGSTSITLAAATGFAAGNLIRISQNDDTSFVYARSGPGRNMEFMARITAVNGTTLTISPPLPFTLSAGLLPQAQYLNGGPGLQWSGIEDLTVVNNAGANDIIMFVGAYACWVKNVELTRANNTFVFWVSSLQCEMRHCYAHEAINFPVNTDGFGIYVYGDSSYCLVEDNIFDRVGAAILQSSSSGNAFMFNYCRAMTFNGWIYQTGGLNAGHGAHPMMCLWEGNISEQWQHDGYHGSASHQVLFRNWLHGLSSLGYTGNRKMVSAERGSHYYSVVGNVLGDASWTNANGFGYEMTGSPGYTEAAVIYRLGYPNVANNSLTAAVGWPTYTGSYPDPQVKGTMIRHGNFDWFNRRIMWESSIPDHNIPNSLFYSSKPAYFGSCPWPAFDPNFPSRASATNIPAGYRFAFGVDPPTGPVNRAPTNIANASPLLGLPPLVVSFSSAGSSDPEGTPLTFVWSFGDGTPNSTAANPSHTYQNNGTYVARLTVSDGTNSVTSNDITIRVGNQLPVLAASATPRSGPAPLVVAFSSAGSSDPEGLTLTYSWDFGDASSVSTAANPSHTYQANGIYTARLTISDGNTSVSSNLVITVNNGLVAAYDFDAGTGSTLSDGSGNGNTGVINGATWATSGRFGRALSFNGAAVVNVNDSPTLDLTDGVTLEAWVFPTSFNADFQSILSKPMDSGFTSISYVLHGGSRPTSLPSFTVFGANNLNGLSVLPLNVWSHLAATYDGATMRLYVNGVQVASRAQTGTVASSAEALRIGLGWAGMIDEVRIYNRALAVSEVVRDMNTSISGGTRPAPPVGLRVVTQ